MDSGEPLVAGADGASTALFQVIEEATQHVARQVEDIELVDGLLLLCAGIWQQKSECVSIASLRVPAQVAFRNQVIEKKALHPWAKNADLDMGRLRPGVRSKQMLACWSSSVVMVR